MVATRNEADFRQLDLRIHNPFKTSWVLSRMESLAGSGCRPVGTTFAPAAAVPTAMARPIPAVPPITMAVLPVESKLE